MPKKNAKQANKDSASAAAADVPPPCGRVYFDASEATLAAAQAKVDLPHVTKAWTRQAWEAARPWILEQKQHLEGSGWMAADGANRMELFGLQRTGAAAKHNIFEEDAQLKIPKKFVDFVRSGRDDSERKHHLLTRKKRDVSYALDARSIWAVRVAGLVDAQANMSTIHDDSDAHSVPELEEPNVQLDVSEPLENIAYLVMCLDPGLITLRAEIKDVIHPGTLVRDTSMIVDEECTKARCHATVSEEETYTRLLPPSFWFARNAGMLRQILGEGYEPTVVAAEDSERSVTREIKNASAREWEETLPVHLIHELLHGKAGSQHGSPKSLKRKGMRKTRRRSSAASNATMVTVSSLALSNADSEATLSSSPPTTFSKVESMGMSTSPPRAPWAAPNTYALVA